MSNSDYIPRKDADFNQWQKDFYVYLTANLSKFSLSTTTLSALTPKKTAWDAKYAIAEAASTRTSVTVLDKTEAREAYEAELRKFISEYLTYNHLVMDTDRRSMGLPVHKTSRTPVPKPDKFPIYRIDSTTIRILRVFFWDGESESKAKPFGVHGVEGKWVFSDTPVDPETMPHSTFDTHSPFELTFRDEQRGKTVWLCLRWENTRGEKGPWSEVISAIVP
jgi:hypothetical protein